ncbi:hypothetical protein N7507_001206 [Penicillium longicatenatum]|nr:hypothetical protein N7507_001206 [Penicillium longicatenatum]
MTVPSVYVKAPLSPLALRFAKPPGVITVRQAVRNARQQDVKYQRKLVAGNIINHYRPRSRKPKLHGCMEEMIFQKNFWCWINKDKVDGQYTPIKIPKYEPPSAPLYPNFGRRFPPTDYPASFWALVEEMKILEDALTDNINHIEVCRDQFAHLEVPPSLVDDIQAGHKEMLNLIQGYLSGEKDGSIAYPDIQVPSFTLWSLLEVIITDHRSMLNSIKEVQQSCAARDNALQRLSVQLPFPGNARLRQHFEVLSNKKHDDASEQARKLLRTHAICKRQFMTLHNHSVNNMSYVPAAGALFEEEKTPLLLDSIFHGFAMNPAVELRAHLWKFSDTD